jgi:hypothetical protein
MTVIRATVRSGRLETDRPINLPDGTEFTIELPNPTATEPDWDTSPEGIAQWIERDKADIPPNLEVAKLEAALNWLKNCDRRAAHPRFAS